MSSFNNPFSIDRAEQLGDNLFEFYANHKNFEGLLKSKSLIIQGGRGSGKTMYFLYHSYFNKKKESISKGIKFIDFLNEEKVIGLYFRADSNFVPAFQHKGINEEEWIQLFGHYLNITLTKRLIEIIIDIEKSYNLESLSVNFDIPEELHFFFPDKDYSNYCDLLKIIAHEEIHLISYINNLQSITRPNVIANGFLLNSIANSILKTLELKDKAIHVFIDEYENMLEYQQKIVNTLVKHPSPVIFNIGMRNKGLKTSSTLAESEIISSPHDFNHFNFEEFNEQEYEEFIVDICKKRLQKVEELKGADEKFFDIKYYLGVYDINYELSNINGNITNVIQSKLKARIGASDEAQILLDSNDPLLLRLHIVLLDRNNNIEILVDEYKKYLKGQKSKYKDWIHNNRNGLIYLIAKESSKDKLYYGFTTYKLLSSGIIRFFIELCESAFKQASRNGFTFSNPRKLTAEEQTQAADHVSHYKVNDIETYTPYSNFLKRFVILLGNVFERFHRDKKLSEPEKNHFSTDYDKLTLESQSFLKNAELYSVLQVRDETKDKSHSIDSNNIEYHLNHIYAPYFQISPRKIRSLKIDANNLDTLINGESQKANEIANALVKNADDNNGQFKISLF
ncbi:hypothetical protein NAT51_18160 [Flavobacterium amniphilum]|uniref:ORC-CDC6 family AAA ATPase n=1 Tax=Flavobacterium amniphilum TaxID=1834035 RepID=UPI00202A8E07|nr:hypothetical protein [Flavobacterium amniphilum]MCL9807457.1 hypothetical protein [Flavobacterium amniphilum]